MDYFSIQRLGRLPVGFILTLGLICVHHEIHQRLRNGIETTQQLENYNYYLKFASHDKPKHSNLDETTPKLVVILSYQRCGSSFFGDLFNKNPDVFYMFEPLDALYSALYGTAQGWNVPSDITNYKNGSQRSLSSKEITDVSEFLRRLLLCDIDSLPVESLTHRYLYNTFYQDDDEYSQCIQHSDIRAVVAKCRSLAPISYCGQRFGENSEQRIANCNLMLNNATYRKHRPEKAAIFRRYLSCRKKLRIMIDDRCTSLMKRKCNNRTIRAVKLVRATMESMEPLLRTLPNFRLIHLIRDPRAVVLSRNKFDSSGQGIYSTDNSNGSMMSREATLYCNTVLRDIKVRMNLEEKYPGKIYEAVYEDVVKNLRSHTSNIYRFINASNPLESAWWKKRIETQSGNKSVGVSNKWKRYLTYKNNKEIIHNCLNFFAVTKYDWPH